MKNKGLMCQLICFLILVAGLAAQSFSKEIENHTKLKKPGDDIASRSRMIDVNNIGMWVQPNGIFASDPNNGHPGLEYPKGSGKTLLNTAGPWVIGVFDKWGSLRTATTYYSTEFQPGLILPDGTPDDPNHEKYHVYKINNGELVPQEVIDQGGPSEVMGDQMLYTVFNDANPDLHILGFQTPPIKLEVHLLVWGYDGPHEALENTVFMQYDFINKDTLSMKEAYVGFFLDPNIGDAGDDWSGCDTILNVGYNYNGKATDNAYGKEVPCIGCDLLQGPLIPSPGDTAILPTGVYPDKKMLQMTAFSNYIKFTTYYMSWVNRMYDAYNIMQGLMWSGSTLIDPTTGLPTKFFNSGDPVLRTGWLASHDGLPNDCKWVMSSGPFNLAAGDTQRVVIALVVGQGSDPISSITWMRYYDRIVQDFYDCGYQVPAEIPVPQISVAELDQRIVLWWDNGATEYESCGYEFQGYNIYQGKSENGPWERIATYDKKDGVQVIWDYAYLESNDCFTELPVQYGQDRGVAFSTVIERDHFSDQMLINGRKYYFGITAYVYNPQGSIRTVETELVHVIAMPHAPPLNMRYEHNPGDTLSVTHTGHGEGECLPIVMDPGRLTGDEYEVSFYMGAGGNTLWKLVDLTTGEEKLTDQSHQGDDDAFLVVDGVFVKVIDSEKAPHGKGDRYTFKTKAPTVSDAIARSRLDEINVFPNPYFGFNKAETNYYAIL